MAERQYRPCVRTWGYTDPLFIQRRYRTNRAFPTPDADNVAIGATGRGCTKPFSAYATGIMPDLHLLSETKWFPRWRYEPGSGQRDLPGLASAGRKADNVSDAALELFRREWPGEEISKDDVFRYVYGVLHAPDWREAFANDLAKGMTRIPLAEDFRAFAEAGGRLLSLHVDGVTESRVDLVARKADGSAPAEEEFRLGPRAMRLSADRMSLRLNDVVTLDGVPPEALEYRVNGRSPVEWLIDRYRIVRDDAGRVVDDPNDWFRNPRDVVDAVQGALETALDARAIIEKLPPSLKRRADRAAPEASPPAN